ncbi:MAG: VWA domain-containing protein [Rhizobiales bacterium]|nr:VWA domain-containing protein [Hyphomicrobiales bacterium]MBO6697926.1 VWA domain-containing protein [Hyphomicrobiales bacterium]MBO6735820.1 VWA domain-containing protein [Hyphomicrobiales bacterium]MBO6913831.1 VWA domain-containing protein [Hyphomicrobiales bacterium]MBO6955534.1 VWA domain-containing protein [Hyphomicrobiales bacterium]
MRQTLTGFFKRLCAVSLGFLALCTLPVNAQQSDLPRAILVFDGSGSMWGQIDGINKIVTARETLARVLPTFPATMELGLMAYGHNRRGDCNDIEMLVPTGPVTTTAGSISAAVNSLNPRGKTPLSEAVRRAALDLRYTEERATIILITDGLETCEADPCALANELESVGIDFTTHVIGFGLTEEEGQQVACLAENTGGSYFQASDADALGEALTQTVAFVPPQPPAPPVPALEPVEQNLFVTVRMEAASEPLTTQDPIRVEWDLEPLDPQIDPASVPFIAAVPSFERFIEPGRYRLTASTNRGLQVSEEITLTATEQTAVDLVFGAGTLDLYAVMLNDGFGLSNTDFGWTIRNLETDRSFTVYARNAREIVPAGRYEAALVITRLESMSPGTVTLDVSAGDVTEQEVIASTARVGFRVFNTDGSELTGFELRHQVLRGPTDQSEVVAGKIGNDTYFLLPGSYTARLEAWDDGPRRSVETVFELAAGDDRIIEATMPDAP